jgi:hypothetical protein
MKGSLHFASINAAALAALPALSRASCRRKIRWARVRCAQPTPQGCAARFIQDSLVGGACGVLAGLRATPLAFAPMWKACRRARLQGCSPRCSASRIGVRAMDDFADDHFARLTDEEIAAASNGPRAACDDDRWVVISTVPAPANGLPPDVVWKVEGTWKEPDATWPYRNGEGRLLGYACRWDIPAKCDGKKPDKQISFATWCRNRNGARRWKLKHLPTPRSLYALDELARRPDAPVLIVEGEKAADAAALIFPESVCVTSSGGSQSVSKSLSPGASSPYGQTMTNPV